MGSDTVRVHFLFKEELNEEKIEDIIRTCLTLGCNTDGDQNEVCTYKTPKSLLKQKDIPIEEAIDALSRERKGQIDLNYKDLKLYLEFNKESSFTPEMPRISLMVWESQFKVYPDSTTEEGANRRAKQLIELVLPLTELTNPEYVYGLAEKYGPEKVRPTEDQIKNGSINRLFWLNIFSSRIVERIGRNRLLSAPAWRVEELSNSHVFLIVTPRPRFYDDKAREIEEYLGIIG